RTTNTALSALCRSLFRVDAPAISPMEPKKDKVCTILAQDAFEGALALAADICKKVEEGARFSDFAVVCANADAYKGILDTEFARCDIPYFLSEKSSLATYEPVKLIYAAYAALCGFAAQDVIAYLKCAFLDTDPDGCDEFELYTQTWRLNGADFTNAAPFTMNPDGYGEKISPYGEEMLKRVNAVKEKLRTSLMPLMGALGEGLTVEAHLRMLYDFLIQNGVPQKIARRAAELKALGDSECDRYERLWQVICDVLDRMFVTLKDKEANAATFAALLKVAFENTDMGRIPSGTDEVLIASAPAMRDSRKYLYLFGVVDGEFPSVSEGSGLFDDAERAHLREAGAALPKTEIYATAAGMYAFYRMLSLAGESLVAVSFRYNASRAACQMPSLWTDAIRLLGENHTLFDTEADPAEDLLWRAESAVQLLGQLSSTDVGASLAACFAENEAFAAYVQAATLDLENATCRLKTVLPEKSGEVTLSQSRIEQYVKCPFSYFGKYVLSLKETKAAHFEANHMGTFIHHLLEHYFGESKKGGKIADKEAFVARLTDEFMQKNTPRDRRTPETEHLVSRLKRLAALILEDLEEEFEAGDFAPVFFELPIGFGAKDGVDAVRYEAKDGTAVRIHGFADRVDAYVQDGDVYVRIVDYKTGTKTFSTDDLKKGMNLQMLLYMVSIMQSDPDFQRKLGVKEGGQVLPAGVVYLNCLPADVKLSAESNAESVISLAKKNIKRSGIYLSDKSILNAMEQAVGARFLPISYTKSGAPTQASEKALKTIEEWNELFKELEETVVSLTDAMRGGMADATPLKSGNRGSCDYCTYKPLCRNAHI
ncbi:MAG: PD-(D/E)XK nuclease family protein, partial [Clostridia bacterium]|nr:PD-(D/E)XK nuclease family protein [Clostridia bacterium]